MRISAVDKNISNLFAFKSLRTDKKEVEVLKNGGLAIGENKKINIQNALNNLALNAEKQSIEFLLDIADNLAYGQNGQSDFATAIDKDTLTTTERENTDWLKILEDTIKRALTNTKEEDTQSLNDEFNRIFSNSKELTPVQQEILDLRKDITSQLLTDENCEDTENLVRITNIRKNLDYFISSSEVSFDERKECLEKIRYILSDEYEINPQLADKKLQVVDEVVNDIIVKAPDDDVLKIKKVDQVETGMCAAISICRKLMAYEEKSKYLNIIIQELSASDEMEVFDVTELGSGKKTKIKKIVVDYDTAIHNGYRIIDAAAHNWMHNAHQVGDGTVKLETYTPFDEENYGIFRDSSWYEGIDESQSVQKDLLKALIKQKTFIKSFENQKTRIEKERVTAKTSRRLITDEMAQINGVLNRTFANIFGSSMSISEQTKLIKATMDFYKESKEDNEVNIVSQMSKELREKLLVDFIKSKTPNITEEQDKKLTENGKKILENIEVYSGLDRQLSKLNSVKSKRAKYSYYNSLFKVAAAHRLAVEADVKLPDSVLRYKNKVKLKPMEMNIVSYMKDLSKSFDSENIRALYKDDNGVVPTKDELKAELLSDMTFIQDMLLPQLNDVMFDFYGQDIKDLVISIYDDAEQQISKNNKAYIEQFSELFGVKKDKVEVLDAVRNVNAQLKKNPSNENIQRAVLAIGHEGIMHIGTILMNSFVSSLQQGIPEETYQQLMSRLNVQEPEKFAEALTFRVNDFNNIVNKYNSIVEKWNVPSMQDVLLKALENKGFVPTRKELDTVYNRIDSIHSQIMKNRVIVNSKEEQKANEKACEFTEKEEKILKTFDDKFTDIKKYQKRMYAEMNRYLKPVLDEQYSNMGMLNGQFWVAEEGGTGLTTVEEIRILEQMTGKPYHVECNVDEAVKEIKKGNGGGIYSSSVYDDDFGFHAQYTPMVTPVEFKNPLTNETSTKDVLWTDNSWGKSESKCFWNGQDGNYYTDYGQDAGWKTGYIFDKSHRIGTPVDTIFGAVGHSNAYDEDFGLFTALILPGVPQKSYTELYKMFNRIFAIGEEGPKYYARLEELLSNGEKVDTKFLSGLDDIASEKSEKLIKRLEKEIKTEEDFNKLSDDDPLKILFEKIALSFATKNEAFKENIFDLETMEDIKEAKESIQADTLEKIADLLCKSPDTLYNMYQVASIDIEDAYVEMEEKFGIKLSDEQRAKIAQSIFEDDETASKLKGPLNETLTYLLNRVPVVAVENFETEEQARFFIEKVQPAIKKVVEENYKIKSLDSPVLDNSAYSDFLINAIDKYLKPKNDKQMLEIIQGFQQSEYKVLEDFLDVLQPEDIGINFQKPWYYVQLYKADNSEVSKAFWDLSATDVIYSNIRNSENDDFESSTPDELYRSLHIRLSEMDVQKYIKKFSAEAFQKYRVRQAFPDPVVFSDDDLGRTVDDTLEIFSKLVLNIESNVQVIEVLEAVEKFIFKYETTKLYKCILNKIKYPVKGNEKLIGQFHKDLTELQQKISVDNSFDKMSENIEKLQIILEDSEQYVDSRKAFVPLNKIMENYNEWQGTVFNKQRFIDLKNDQLKNLKEGITIFVESNIEPRYRDNAYTILNDLIVMYKNDAPEEVIIEQEEKMRSLMVDKHITKNPTMLLKECVEKCQKGEMDNDIYDVLKSYLMSSLAVALQTKIQYKLVQNQHEGISSKTKDMLSMFHVTYSDGSSKGMETDDGLIYLCQKLKNSKDNNLMLNLFLQQSGLSQRAVKSIVENFNLDKLEEIVDDQVDLIKTYLEHLKLVRDAIQEHLKKDNLYNQKFDSYMKGLVNHVKLRTSNVEDSLIIDDSINILSQAKLSDEAGVISPSMLPALVENIADSVLDQMSLKVNDQIEALDYIGNYIVDDSNLLWAITLPENCEEAKMREEFQEKLDEKLDYKREKSAELAEFITENGLGQENID